MTLNQLDNINGLPLSKKDATINAEVLWMYKGKTPYEATIVGIQTDTGRSALALPPLWLFFLSQWLY